MHKKNHYTPFKRCWYVRSYIDKPQPSFLGQVSLSDKEDVGRWREDRSMRRVNDTLKTIYSNKRLKQKDQAKGHGCIRNDSTLYYQPFLDSIKVETVSTYA